MNNAEVNTYLCDVTQKREFDSPHFAECVVSLAWPYRMIFTFESETFFAEGVVSLV